MCMKYKSDPVRGLSLEQETEKTCLIIFHAAFME